MKIINLTHRSFRLRLNDGTVLDCVSELDPFDHEPSLMSGGLASDVCGFKIYSTQPCGELPDPEPGVFYVVPKDRCILEGRADLLYLPDRCEFTDSYGVYKCLAY